MKLQTCETCAGPRRSLSQTTCSRCRKHPKSPCPECGELKGVDQERCIRCHARHTAAATGPKRRRQVARTCEECGSGFEVAQNVATKGFGRFCSRACKIKWFGKTFNGESHWRTGEKITKACRFCGQSFVVTPGFAVQAFCSKGCADADKVGKRTGAEHPNWRGGRVYYYGPTWTAAQRAARARDKTCRVCGATASHKRGARLSVHHIRPFREFGVERHAEANALSNLITLCTACHGYAHRRYIQPTLGL